MKDRSDRLEPMPARKFESGATRNSDVGKLAYEGFLSPAVLRRFAEFMHKHRHQADGTLRAPDNWQQGIPFDVYMDSLIRHVMAIWLIHRGHDDVVDERGASVNMQDELCAVMFNAMGALFEDLGGKQR